MTQNQQKQKIEQYLDLLQKWQKIYNLTAITNRDDMYSHHIDDSLSVLPFIKDQQGFNVFDVGTGAGLPGIALAIYAPNTTFHLIDTVGKKITFLQVVVAELELKNVFLHHARVETLKLDIKADVIVARAFASIADFANLCGHLAQKDTTFIAMKGKMDKTLSEILPEGFNVNKILPIKVKGLDEERTFVFFNKEIVNNGQNNSLC